MTASHFLSVENEFGTARGEATMSAAQETSVARESQPIDSVIDHARAAVVIGASFGASALLTFGMFFA